MVLLKTIEQKKKSLRGIRAIRLRLLRSVSPSPGWIVVTAPIAHVDIVWLWDCWSDRRVLKAETQ